MFINLSEKDNDTYQINPNVKQQPYDLLERFRNPVGINGNTVSNNAKMSNIANPNVNNSALLSNVAANDRKINNTASASNIGNGSITNTATNTATNDNTTTNNNTTNNTAIMSTIANVNISNSATTLNNNAITNNQPQQPPPYPGTIDGVQTLGVYPEFPKNDKNHPKFDYKDDKNGVKWAIISLPSGKEVRVAWKPLDQIAPDKGKSWVCFYCNEWIHTPKGHFHEKHASIYTFCFGCTKLKGCGRRFRRNRELLKHNCIDKYIKTALCKNCWRYFNPRNTHSCK